MDQCESYCSEEPWKEWELIKSLFALRMNEGQSLMSQRIYTLLMGDCPADTDHCHSKYRGTCVFALCVTVRSHNVHIAHRPVSFIHLVRDCRCGCDLCVWNRSEAPFRETASVLIGKKNKSDPKPGTNKKLGRFWVRVMFVKRQIILILLKYFPEFVFLVNIKWKTIVQFLCVFSLCCPIHRDILA